MEKRIKYLESLVAKHKINEEDYRKKFEKSAGYLGGGCYGWLGVHSTDTRELFLMGILMINGIRYKER